MLELVGWEMIQDGFWPEGDCSSKEREDASELKI
jgi:hypothetical protein